MNILIKLIQSASFMTKGQMMTLLGLKDDVSRPMFWDKKARDLGISPKWYVHSDGVVNVPEQFLFALIKAAEGGPKSVPLKELQTFLNQVMPPDNPNFINLDQGTARLLYTWYHQGDLNNGMSQEDMTASKPLLIQIATAAGLYE